MSPFVYLVIRCYLQSRIYFNGKSYHGNDKTGNVFVYIGIMLHGIFISALFEKEMFTLFLLLDELQLENIDDSNKKWG